MINAQKNLALTTNLKNNILNYVNQKHKIRMLLKVFKILTDKVKVKDWMIKVLILIFNPVMEKVYRVMLGLMYKKTFKKNKTLKWKKA